MTTSKDDPNKLVARLLADADNDALDDATFRQCPQRTARRLQRAMAFPMKVSGTAARRRSNAPSRYRFIAVPNGAGGTTSISLASAAFDALAKTFGGADEVIALARKVATGHKPESDMTRSAYVLRRLQQRAACSSPPQPSRSR